MIGVYKSRHKILRNIMQKSDAKSVAKELLQYYEDGGSLDNIFQLLERKPPEILSARDLQDHANLVLENLGCNIANSTLDADTQKIAITITETKREVLQKATNRLGFPIIVQPQQTNNSLLVTLDASKIVAKTTVVEAKNPKRYAKEVGRPYVVAKQLFEKKGAIVSKPKETCRMCFSTLVESFGTYVCKSCGIEETTPKIVEHKSDCYYCGGNLVENTCQDCKWVYKKEFVETTVAASTAPGVTTQQSTVYPGACPCGGSVLFVGDSYRCLTCDKPVEKNDLGDFTKDKQENKVVDFTLQPMYESNVFFRKDNTAIIFEDTVASAPDTNYLVVVKDQEKISEVYEYMLSQGYVTTAPVYQQTQQGWQPVDGMPSGIFAVTCETSELANQVHDDLMSKGYDSEIASRVEMKREDSEQQKSDVPKERCEDGEVAGYEGKTVYKFATFDQAQEFAQKGDNDLGREQEVIQGNDGKYWVTTPEIARELRKDINAKVLKHDPEEQPKEPQEDHLPDTYSGEYTGKPDVTKSDDDLRQKKEKMSYYKGQSGGYGGQHSTFDYQHAFPESTDDYGMPAKESTVSSSVTQIPVSKIENEIGDVNAILRSHYNSPKSNLVEINKRLQNKNLNPITEGKLQVILHLKSKNIGVNEIISKTGLTEEVVKTILEQ